MCSHLVSSTQDEAAAMTAALSASSAPRQSASSRSASMVLAASVAMVAAVRRIALACSPTRSCSTSPAVIGRAMMPKSSAALVAYLAMYAATICGCMSPRAVSRSAAPCTGRASTCSPNRSSHVGAPNAHGAGGVDDGLAELLGGDVGGRTGVVLARAVEADQGVEVH